MMRTSRHDTDFNPRSREGSDGASREDAHRLLEFQSTLPRRERPYKRFWRGSFKRFQSTLPRRERHQTWQQANGKPVFQSTLPRRERQLFLALPFLLLSISIHAPAKGATSTFPQPPTHQKISIHAPAKGATMEASKKTYYFEISIHAPAKGATIMEMPCLRLHRHFNPRSREGSDPVPSLSRLDYPFQSTLPRRERPLASLKTK